MKQTSEDEPKWMLSEDGGLQRIETDEEITERVIREYGDLHLETNEGLCALDRVIKWLDKGKE